jgi:hypothetical protein
MSGQRKSSRGGLGEFHMTTTLFRYGSPYSLLKELISTCTFYKYLLVFQSTARHFLCLYGLVFRKSFKCYRVLRDLKKKQYVESSEYYIMRNVMIYTDHLLLLG